MLALWDSPRQREAYDWFTVELANLRAAFRWAADHDDLDTAAAIAFYAAFLGIWVEQYEPVGWAEELIEPATGRRHRRLAQLYIVAAQCYAAGRIDEAIGYGEAAEPRSRADATPTSRSSSRPITRRCVLPGRQPERCGRWCRNAIARSPGQRHLARAHPWSWRCHHAGHDDEAMAASKACLRAADTSTIRKSYPGAPRTAGLPARLTRHRIRRPSREA